jgi:2-polyprenyl-6-methoxyphenol hydroxylase-like FAD-dependent oxidoreductase
MKSKYDVIVVGGRVAGTSLAIQLARLGMDVVIFDRARLPGDTMSTHVIYPNTIARLDNLGVLDRVMAHRPPPLYTAWYHQNRMFVSPHTPEAGRDWALCIRRSTLDRHLQDCAREAGVDIVDNAPVNTLLGTGDETDPVRGVIASIDDRAVSIESDLVVGADGASSTVAARAGAQPRIPRLMRSSTVVCATFSTRAIARMRSPF